MNALVAGEGKLKPVLSGHGAIGAAQADQPIGEQRGDLAPTLRRCHVLRGEVGNFMHWLSRPSSNSLEPQLSDRGIKNAIREFWRRAGCCGLVRKPGSAGI
jgi:hypothetical protein